MTLIENYIVTENAVCVIKKVRAITQYSVTPRDELKVYIRFIAQREACPQRKFTLSVLS